MNGFDRAQRDWETPPDIPEAVFCDECGDELEILDDFGGERYTECVNEFCPTKFDYRSISQQMAIILIEQEQDIEKLQVKIRQLEYKLKHIVIS